MELELHDNAMIIYLITNWNDLFYGQWIH
jgi:hypothetical protein